VRALLAAPVKTGGKTRVVTTPLPAVVSDSGKVNYRPFRLNGEPRYIEVYIPTHPNAAQRSGWVAVHRVIAENKIGRPLNKGERVMFRDGNTFNFSPENVFVAWKAQA